MAEKEPSLPLKWGNRKIEMTAHNSQLYTFIGRTTISLGTQQFDIERSALNHVWVTTAKDKGLYFWEQYDPEEYSKMSSFILEHGFPTLLNARNVTPYDVHHWLQEVDKKVEVFRNTIPDSF